MKSTQAWGWLTAGVLALGLNGIYHDGGADWAHRNMDRLVGGISDPSRAVIALASGRADWLVAKTGIVAEQRETAVCRFNTAIARLQTKFARAGSNRFEIMSAREEVAMARMEADRARIEQRADRMRVAAFNPVICPRMRVRVPRVDVSVPGVHIETVSDELQ
jgi:hypothetical protein